MGQEQGTAIDEKGIMQLITSEYSWEQIIYKIVAWEGMDPWNLDLGLLSRSFMAYISKMKELDFKIPAKYVVIAAVLLRMKSDHIEYLKSLTRSGEEEPAGAEELPQDAGNENGTLSNGDMNLELASLDVPSTRQPTRKIVVTELIAALRSALRTDARRSERGLRRRGQIVINEENITERIESLYRKIDSLLARLREEEIEFSKLLSRGDREEVLNTFIPLVHLDHEKKVHCRQEELFREIFVKKAVPGQKEDGRRQETPSSQGSVKPSSPPGKQSEQPKEGKPGGRQKLKSIPRQKGVKGRR